MVSSWVMTMPNFNADYVGVSIKKHCNSFYEFALRTLIDSIIENVGISNSKTKPVPAKVFL
jgi:hypothetical protein